MRATAPCPSIPLQFPPDTHRQVQRARIRPARKDAEKSPFCLSCALSFRPSQSPRGGNDAHKTRALPAPPPHSLQHACAQIARTRQESSLPKVRGRLCGAGTSSRKTETALGDLRVCDGGNTPPYADRLKKPNLKHGW